MKLIPGIFIVLAGYGFSQTVPIYHVTIVDRTVSAINYQYRSGPTLIDFHGTALLPESKGEATVESKTGRTEIDARFQHLETPARFGPEYLTYVLWAITPEGHVKNLGEVMANGSDKAHLHATTDLQAFGLIVTAEPYSSVRLPSDVVVLENQARPDTMGSTEPIRARYELLPRGTYTYNVPADLKAVNSGPKVSMDKYEELVEVYQATNAVQIARSQDAAQYAPDVLAKAEQELTSAQQLQASKAGVSAVVTKAREAAQTAEDARTLSATKKKEADLAQAREQASREQQLRADAEQAARKAEAQAREEHDALEAERAEHRDADARMAALTAPAPPPPPAQFVPPPTGAHVESRQKMDLRNSLFRQLSSAMQTLDSPRGLVVTVRDSDFRGAAPSPDALVRLALIGPILAAQPGLVVQVEGYTDSAGSQGESLASRRAEAVRDALQRDGLRSVSARGMGTSRPLGPNSGPAGREQNRRIEIVISGDSIGNLPSWDKTYTLSQQR